MENEGGIVYNTYSLSFTQFGVDQTLLSSQEALIWRFNKNGKLTHWVLENTKLTTMGLYELIGVQNGLVVQGRVNKEDKSEGKYHC